MTKNRFRIRVEFFGLSCGYLEDHRVVQLLQTSRIANIHGQSISYMEQLGRVRQILKGHFLESFHKRNIVAECSIYSTAVLKINSMLEFMYLNKVISYLCILFYYRVGFTFHSM